MLGNFQLKLTNYTHHQKQNVSYLYIFDKTIVYNGHSNQQGRPKACASSASALSVNFKWIGGILT